MLNNFEKSTPRSRTDYVDEYVGKQLKRRRILLGKTQNEVAKSLGISMQQLQKYEKAENRISSSKLYGLAKELRVQVNYFFEGCEKDRYSFAEDVAGFEHDNISNEKELLHLINAFKVIQDSKVKKQIIDLVRTLAEKHV